MNSKQKNTIPTPDSPHSIANNLDSSLIQNPSDTGRPSQTDSTVSAQQQPRTTPPTSTQPKQDYRHTSSSKKKIILMSSMVIILILLSFAIFILVKNTLTHTTSTPLPTNQEVGSTINSSSLASAYDSFSSAGVVGFSHDKKAHTLDAFEKLSKGFELDKSYMDNTPLTLVLLGVSRGFLDHPDQMEGYRNTLYLALNNYMLSVPRDIDDQFFISPEKINKKIPEILKKYTDQSLTQQFSDVMQTSGVEEEAQKSLGLSKLNPYTPLVMNFDQGSQGQQQMRDEAQMLGVMPKMWVWYANNQMFLVTTRDYGQDFIHSPNGSSRHSVIHELIHTQNNFLIGELGRSVEERRAEFFSGDNGSYYDAKQMFIYSYVFSGFSPLNTMEKYSTDNTSFYLALYANLGIEGANAFIASAPNAFLQEPSGAIKKSQETFGGMDGVIKIALLIGSKDKVAMEQRTSERYQKLKSILTHKQKVIDDLKNNLSQAYNMPTASKAMLDYINRH